MVTQVDLAFERLLREFKKKKSVWRRTKDGKTHVTMGSWTLSQSYGGFVVEEISNKGGGVSDPFGSRRRGRAEFVRWVNDIILARRIGKRRRN